MISGHIYEEIQKTQNLCLFLYMNCRSPVITSIPLCLASFTAVL